MLNLKTGQPLPESDPAMQLVMKVYEGFTMEEKESFHRVMVLNSRDPKDLAVVMKISQAVECSNLEGDKGA